MLTRADVDVEMEDEFTKERLSASGPKSESMLLPAGREPCSTRCSVRNTLKSSDLGVSYGSRRICVGMRIHHSNMQSSSELIC